MAFNRYWIVMGVAILMAAVPASAQHRAAEPSADQDIVVTAKREGEIRHFVNKMAPWRYGRQLARWHDPICVQITGLEEMPAKAALVRGWIENVARSVRIGIARKEACHPNILITFSTRADSLTAQVIEKYPSLIKDVRRNGLPHGHDRAPYLEPRAVRWFAVDNETLAATGQVIGQPDAGGISVGTLSRIGEQTKETASLSYVIVDESRIGGITWRQLADYLAMVTLARPTIDATYSGEDTILSLFDNGHRSSAAPPELTRQDQAYLDALYAANAELPPDMERDQIRRHMAAALATDKPTK